ncbi:NUDIX domain-containing protein [Aegicerativicinus sediminis]|uniref:NUDIX domain-containing protein n=1 Tax=Aegicerativicinus sediminis TaxID=2893202 RepID=UPI001E4B6A8A|nr:NUDIX domain-containing protein [Aegicerativicinus sediminis]
MSDRVKDLSQKILSDRVYKLYEVTFGYQLQSGKWVEKNREVFDRGNGATVLLYNKDKGTIILNYQFRVPTLLNGNESGFMIETPAGVIEEKDSTVEESMIREIEEETGYRVESVKKVMELFMTPAAVTEKIYYFIAPYTDDMKVSEGGGVAEEHEDIKVLEMPFSEAVSKIESGEIVDAKTVILLQYAQIQKLME